MGLIILSSTEIFKHPCVGSNQTDAYIITTKVKSV